MSSTFAPTSKAFKEYNRTLFMLESESPGRLGLSSKRLQRLDDWVQQQVSGGRLAGASVLIGKQGKLGFFSAAGHADIEQQRTFNRDSIVRIYSMTKPVTTVAAMMLYEQGHFQLDDPIARYLPEFADTPVWRGGDSPLSDTEKQQSPITVRQLMNHTSGLTYDFMRATAIDAAYRDNGVSFQSGEGTLAEMTQKLAEVPLLCQPGSQWNYSVSTDVLGRLVEVWSGQSLQAYFDTHILQPLQMRDTGFSVAPHNSQRFSAMYGPTGGAGLGNVGRTDTTANLTGKATMPLKLLEAAEGSRFTQETTLYSGGGGLTGSIDDYARFCQMLLNGGELDGVRLLSPTTVEYMCTNQLPDNGDMAAMGQPVWSETNYDGIGFGLGFAVVIDPVKAHIITSAGECHWGGAASTFFWIDHRRQLFSILFTQLMPSSTYPLRRELRSLVYQSIVS
jgi:CubicO group peptidase (beta-lactamase class C family)